MCNDLAKPRDPTAAAGDRSVRMRAVEISRFGPPEVLVETTRPVPIPGPGEVLIRVSASGVNRPDVMQRRGDYPPPPGASDLPGLEVAGTILAGDAGALAAAGLRIGDSVCALTAGGGYAEYCTAPLGQCLPMPPGLSMVEAAALPETFFTVWLSLFKLGGLKSGETALVHGGSSGIGVTAIQLGKAFGAAVLVTAGSEEKCEACSRLGADLAINYRTTDFVAEVRQFTRGRGADVILDMVAGDYVAREIDCLANDGRLVVIAVMGGKRTQLDVGQLLFRRLTIIGSTLRARSIEFKSAIAAELRQRVWPLITAKRVQPVIAHVFPASEAAQAHILMESSAHIGKIVLDWTV
jgi:NADPH:quinone reductase